MATQSLNPVFFFLMTISLIFLIHFLSPGHAASNSNLVEGVCRESQNYSFCIQALESDPKTPAAKDYMDLAVISLNLGISNSTATRSYIARLYKNQKTDHRKKSALKSCLWGYDGAISSFKSALTELNEDPLTANYDAKVAGDGAVYCSSFMASARITDSLISDGNRFTSSLSFIAFVITNHLE